MVCWVWFYRWIYLNIYSIRTPLTKVSLHLCTRQRWVLQPGINNLKKLKQPNWIPHRSCIFFDKLTARSRYMTGSSFHGNETHLNCSSHSNSLNTYFSIVRCTEAYTHILQKHDWNHYDRMHSQSPNNILSRSHITDHFPDITFYGREKTSALMYSCQILLPYLWWDKILSLRNATQHYILLFFYTSHA